MASASLFILMSLLGVGLLASFGSGEAEELPEEPTPDFPDSEDVVPPETNNFVESLSGNADIDDADEAEGTRYDLGGNSNTLDAGSGDDVVNTQGDYNFVRTGDGDDLIRTGDGRDFVDGGAGNDTLLGGDGFDSFNDREGSSLVFAGGGDDQITVSGDSTVEGGEGSDTISFWMDLGEENPVIITDFNPEEDRIGSVHLEGSSTDPGELEVVGWEDGSGAYLTYGNTHIASIYAAEGTSFDEESLAELYPSSPYAPDEDEQVFDLTVRVGDGDVFEGGANDERIQSLDGASTIYGGAGDDFISDSRSGETGEILDGGAGNDTITLLSGQDALAPPTQVYGGEGDDVIVVRESEAIISGGEGADTIGVMNYFDMSAYSAPLVTDFDPTEDVIVLDALRLPGGSEGEISISIWEDGTGADIIANGQIIVSVAGGQSLTPNDIVVSEDIGWDYLGFH